jgi:hypothetical protein
MMVTVLSSARTGDAAAISATATVIGTKKRCLIEFIIEISFVDY